MNFFHRHSTGVKGSEAKLRSRLTYLLLPVTLLTISSAGCDNGQKRAELEARENELASVSSALDAQKGDLKQWESKLIAGSAKLDTRESDLKHREHELRNWDAELRSRSDKLKVQELSIREQITQLEETHRRLSELQAANKRGPVPEIEGKRAIVIDAKTGKVLFEKSADEPCAVASTQKLLTGLLVAESGDLSKLITVDEADTQVEPTKLYIKPGEQLSRLTVLTGLLVRSGNDLALCLARDCAGSVEAFAKKMNKRASELEMRASHFINPHGLTEDGQRSTARDMAKLARAAYNNPIIRGIVNRKSFEFEHGDGTKKPLTNTNQVLRTFDLCDGMKTGYTHASGKCLICSGKNGQHARIVVVLGSSGSFVWKDARSLLEWSLKG